MAIKPIKISPVEFRLIKARIQQSIDRANAHLSVDWDDKGEALRQVVGILKLAQLTLADIENDNE